MKNIPVTIHCSSLLILLFTYTAISKLTDYEKFVRVLDESPLIHKGADTIAWLLPVTELIVVLLLFFERTRRMGLYASLALLTVFTIYIGCMLLFVAELPCNCGGVLNKMSWQQHLFFNAGFLVINVIGIGRTPLYELLNFLRRQGMPKT
ncbi:MauE/DoxX family redox-associated membrane protein [Lacibacter sp. H375]|uniref:MauE/DoxX family redox-associated membrane protein n=1 Tax=Lacibacter sp. H375 TaxID=3133424 RepID=UPI0030BACE3D